MIKVKSLKTLKYEVNLMEDEKGYVVSSKIGEKSPVVTNKVKSYNIASQMFDLIIKRVDGSII